MRTKKLLALIAVMVTASAAMAADHLLPPHYTDFAEARAASAERGLPLLIDFWKYD